MNHGRLTATKSPRLSAPQGRQSCSPVQRCVASWPARRGRDPQTPDSVLTGSYLHAASSKELSTPLRSPIAYAGVPRRGEVAIWRSPMGCRARPPRGQLEVVTETERQQCPISGVGWPSPRGLRLGRPFAEPSDAGVARGSPAGRFRFAFRRRPVSDRTRNDDAAKPGRPALGIAQPGQVAPRSNEGLLQGVLGIVMLA